MESEHFDVPSCFLWLHRPGNQGILLTSALALLRPWFLQFSVIHHIFPMGGGPGAPKIDTGHSGRSPPFFDSSTFSEEGDV